MAEKGVFRTSAFGGFNKKDVLKYFEELQNEKNAANTEALKQNEVLKKELEEKSQKISELLGLLDKTTEKAEALEQKVAALEDESKKNAKLETALFEANKALEENQDFKSRFEEVSRKLLKVKSDYIIKESDYKKLETKYSALKGAVDLLPKMNESDFAKARESLDEIANIINELQKLNYSIDRIKD